MNASPFQQRKIRRPLVEVVWLTLMACSVPMIVVAMAKGMPGAFLGFFCLYLGFFLSLVADRKLQRNFSAMRLVLLALVSLFLLMFSSGACGC